MGCAGYVNHSQGPLVSGEPDACYSDRSAFRLLDWEEERRIAKTTAVMLKRFENDQALAPAEKEFNEAQEIEAAFDRDFDGLDAT